MDRLLKMDYSLKEIFLHTSFLKIFIALLILASFFFTRKMFVRYVINRAHRYKDNSKKKHIASFLIELEGPLKLIFLLIGASLALRILELEYPAYAISSRLLSSAIIFTLFWALYKAIKPLADIIEEYTTLFGASHVFDARAFFTSTLKFVITITGVIVLMQEWEYNVTGFIASLGIVGAALAFAAKDSVSNIFGSFTIFLDETFERGDHIKTSEAEGIVEFLGIRSTRIRTADKSIITIPNSRLANQAIINLSKAASRNIKATFFVDHQTTNEQLNRLLNEVRAYLKNHPNIRKENINVYLNKLEEMGAGISVSCFTNNYDYVTYMSIQEECLLKIRSLIEEIGIEMTTPHFILQNPQPLIK